MTILESNIALHVLKQTQSEIGNLYFFEHIAVVEFNEGTHVDLVSTRPLIYELFDYFGSSIPFGLIANRVNSYSISLLDSKDIKLIFPNLVAYGVVSHNEAGRMNAEIESQFCSLENISFDNLYECLDTVHKRVKEKISLSLN